jgi:hypothetical protein
MRRSSVILAAPANGSMAAITNSSKGYFQSWQHFDEAAFSSFEKMVR